MPGCLIETLSALWIALRGKYRLTQEDQATVAEHSLGQLMETLERRLESIQQQQEVCFAEVVAQRQKNAKRAKQKFIEYKRLEAQKERVFTYKDMVLAHMDALNNTELNHTFIHTLQESSKTLKAMGVVDGVRQAELVVSDVEASMQQAQELTQVLGQPIHVDYKTEEWENEFEAMLREDEMAQAVPPKTVDTLVKSSRSAETQQNPESVPALAL